MKVQPYYIFAVLFFCFSIISLAQKPPIKIGDINADIVKMEEYPNDPEAEAVVLCDFGHRTWKFVTSGNPGWRHELKRICRIKIFNDEGYDWATESFSLYDNGDIEEAYTQLKGYTYNLEKGKVVKTKLSKDNIFVEESSENTRRVKFTMPNVKAGSVIEFQYSISSNYHTIIEPWYFQRSIPVAWSEYIVSIPKFFTYVQNNSGFESYHVYETDVRHNAVTWIDSERADPWQGKQGSVSHGKRSYTENYSHYVIKDAPALKDEAYVGNSRNYMQSVGYQLSVFESFGGRKQNILGGWPEVIKKFSDDYENFGDNMRARSFYKDVTNPIIEKYSDPIERAAAVYTYVSNHMKWNEKRGMIPDQNIRKSHDERTGSAADINGLLISMLRAVEVDTDPVILSTVDHGLVHPIYPMLDKYNYMIARVNIGGKSILMDATEKNMPLGLLPTRCLNQRGYAISKTKPGWVDLIPQDGYNRSVMAMLSIDEEGTMSGDIQYRFNGYNGLNTRKKLRSDGKDKLIEDFTSAHTDWTIKSMEIEDEELIGEPLKEKIEVDITGKGEAMGAMIYIDPILVGKVDENPFKQETRKLPIEFVIPIKDAYMMYLEIPEGYIVEEIPESVNIVTPDKTAYLKYMTKVMGNRIQIVNQWGIKKTFYTPESYQELKEFYAMLVSKHNEQIVLKKATVN